MRIKFNDKIYRLKEIESGVDSLMELVEEPRYRDGDFLRTKSGNLFIFKRFGRVRDEKEDSAFCHFFTSVFKCYREYGLNKNGVCFKIDIEGYCTPEERQKILDDLAKDGKRWNAEKKCIEDIPIYKDGDFVVNDLNAILIFKEAYGNLVSDHAYLPVYGELVIDKVVSCKGIKRHATTEEKQRMIDALAEQGKRWNYDKKCIEDIPKRKFKAGDKVRIKDGISSETHRYVSPNFTETMDEFIGKELIVEKYNSRGFVVFFGRYFEYEFSEDWLEPWSDEPKKGDLAIFWNNEYLKPLIRLYHGKTYSGNNHIDNFGYAWDNAVKWDGTVEQFEKIGKA